VTPEEIIKLVTTIGAPSALCFFLVKHVLKKSDEAEKRGELREIRLTNIIDTTCFQMTAALKDLNERSMARHHETHDIIREEGASTRRVIHEKGHNEK
jgi:hypothetical protein